MIEVSTLPELKRTYHAARLAMVERCNSAGMTQTEAAQSLGVTLTCLNNIIHRHGVVWRVVRQGHVGRNWNEGERTNDPV